METSRRASRDFPTHRFVSMIRFSLKDRKNGTNHIVPCLPYCLGFVSDDCNESKRMKRITGISRSGACSAAFLSPLQKQHAAASALSVQAGGRREAIRKSSPLSTIATHAISISCKPTHEPYKCSSTRSKRGAMTRAANQSESVSICESVSRPDRRKPAPGPRIVQLVLTN